MKGRKLFFFGSDRYLSGGYICEIDQLPLKKILEGKEFISNGTKHALDDSMQIMVWFNWDRVPREVFGEDQKKFLERRI